VHPPTRTIRLPPDRERRGPHLFGSTRTGYLAGKLLTAIDIREHGSKSIGETNVLRILGEWPALVVRLVDVLKGAGPIVSARWFYLWFFTLSSVTPS
jgi:acyl phosphate:glycerol-3-phosphate acyltransferase